MRNRDRTGPHFWRILILVFGVFLGLFIIHDSKAQELPSSLLWKIGGNGIEPSYLYGTFHLLPQKDFLMKEKVTKAFNDSEQVVLELDMDDPNLQMNMMQNATMKDGKTLDQLFTEEDYQMIDRILLATTGTGLENYNTVKPFILSSMLIPTLLEGQPASFEATFTQMAIQNSKEILGLETVEEQLNVFDQIPYEDQIEDILDIVNDRERMKNLFTSMIEIYKEEDINKMFETISELMDGEMELEYLLLQRNRNWIPRIGELGKDKRTFFGVGAGHLGGDQGVVNLLKMAGYKVTAIN
jgi:uncharacterized protein YbaP (TraB family)